MSNVSLKSPDENHFAITPQNRSLSNVFRSDDCNELLAKELATLDENQEDQSHTHRFHLISQSSVEIDISNEKETKSVSQSEPEFLGEVSLFTITHDRCVWFQLYFEFFWRNGPFWTFTLAFHCSMSTAIHESVNILSKHFVTMKCKKSRKYSGSTSIYLFLCILLSI